MKPVKIIKIIVAVFAVLIVSILGYIVYDFQHAPLFSSDFEKTLKLAIKTKDVSLCDKFPEGQNYRPRSKCYEKYALETGDITACFKHYIPVLCSAELVAKYKDISFCEKLRDNLLKEELENINTESEVYSCYNASFARLTTVANTCEAISKDENSRFLCVMYTGLSEETGGAPKFCNSAPAQLVSRCKEYFGIN